MEKFVVYKVIYSGDKLPMYYIGSPRPENIINGVIVFKQKSKKKSTNGWLIKCLD